ncbi:MAG: hypothetical protein ABI237_18525 [Ginsengibacter sp.]
MKYFVFFSVLFLLLFSIVILYNKKENRHMNTKNTVSVNGATIEFKELSKEEYLQNQKNAKLLMDLSSIFNIEAFELSNKKVVVKDKETFTMYNSVMDVRNVYRDFVNSGGIRSALFGKNPYGKDFDKETLFLINNLLDTLNINRNVKLDKALLTIIDARLNKNQYSTQFIEEHLISIIALLGEVFKNEFVSQWKLELSKDNQTWVPIIIYKDNKIAFYNYLLEDIENHRIYNNYLMCIYKTMQEVAIHNIDQ